MGANFSVVVPRGFGTVGGLDRTRLHDVPWVETLKRLGNEKFFAVDVQELERFLVEASDEELHCCRAFFRAYREFCRRAEPGDERDFADNVFFLEMQQPTHLMMFYTMLHQCWKRGLLVQPNAKYGAVFAAECFRLYAEEKGAPMSDEEDNDNNDQQEDEELTDEAKRKMQESINGILATYLDSVADMLSNPELQDASQRSFGITPQGEAHVFTLRAKDESLEVQVTNYGACVVSCRAYGVETTVSYATAEEYVRDQEYRGAIVGRYAGRIAGASFTANGKSYHVEANEGANHLHGGSAGFSKKLWRIDDDIQHSTGSRQAFFLDSDDGDMGFPGRLRVRVEYAAEAGGKLSIRYNALLIAPEGAPEGFCCPVNLTNHTYWRLGGSLNQHMLWADCDKYVELSDGGIATGKLLAVEGTALDFNKERALESGVRVDACLCVAGFRAGSVKHVATLRNVETKLKLLLHTSEPGLVVYTGANDAVCLECEKFPDSPNHANFPSCFVNTKEQYAQLTVFEFRKDD